MGSAQAGVPKNSAVKLLELDGDGLNLIDICNIGDVNLVAAYVRRSTGVNLRNLTDTQVTDESTSDGNSLDSTPISPGSLSLSATGITTLVDKNRDGVLYFDRVVGSVLKTAADGVTSVPGTRTLTSATGDFINNGVVAGDQVVLTRKDKGSYTVVAVTATVLTLDANFPTGSNTGVTYFVKANEIAAGTVDYFTGLLNLSYPSSPAAASPSNKGTVVGTVDLPVNLNPGDTLVIDIDGGGNATATFDAAQAVLNCNANATKAAELGASASENLTIKIDDGDSQVISFGAGTESTAAQYAAVITAQLNGAIAEADANSLEAMIGSVNELKADYTAHIADTTVHAAADTTNTVSAADATNQATAITLANELKADYNAHRSEVGVHTNDDAGNAVAAADATDLATLVTLVAELKLDYNAHAAEASEVEEAITLLNEIKADYEAHRVLVGGGEHVNADSTNAVSAADATDQATAVTLANDLKAQLNAHDAALSTLEEAITLVNELKADYEAHRADTATVHEVADTTNTISAADATDLSSAQTLANELKADYNAHRSQATVHVNDDTGNAVSSADATDLATLKTLANEIKTDFNAHLAEVSTLEECITLVNEIKVDYEAHRILTAGSVHGAADSTNVVSSADATNQATAITLANELKVDYEAHRVLTAGSVHGAADNTNTISAADASDLATLVTLVNDLRTQYEAHRVLIAGSVHGAADSTNTVSAVAAETNAIHKNDDTVNVTTADAVDTAAVHLVDDTTNVVSSADATDFASLKTLANELRTDYEAHRQDTSSHGAADSTNTVSAVAVGTAGIHQTDDVTNVMTSQPDSVKITSDSYGTGSKVEIVSGTGSILAKLGYIAGSVSGTGDVANINAVTFTEAKTIIEADVTNTLCQLEDGKLRISSDSSNEDANSTIQVSSTSTAEDNFGLDTTLHAGDDDNAKQPISATYIQSTLITSPGYSQQKVIGRHNDLIDIYFAAAGSGGKIKVGINCRIGAWCSR